MPASWSGALSRVQHAQRTDGGDDHFAVKYDVAVVPLSLDDEFHQVSSISTRQFLDTPKQAYLDHVGVGDDVFMLGLFIDHYGVSENVPSARFGNISMMPNSKAKIKQATGYMGESFVLDMHSRTGFSGSPVYVYRTFGANLTEPWGTQFENLELDWNIMDSGGPDGPQQVGPLRGRIRSHTLFRFLGIHWGQFPERWELRDRSELNAESRQDLIVEGGYVNGMSGMTTVIPAWQIMEVFDMPYLKKLRHPAGRI